MWAKGFKKLLKVQNIAQSGHTGQNQMVNNSVDNSLLEDQKWIWTRPGMAILKTINFQTLDNWAK